MKYVLTVYILSCLYPHTFLLLLRAFNIRSSPLWLDLTTKVVNTDHQGGYV